MNSKLQTFTLLFLLTGFAIGLIQLFSLRFESGDVYPPYSSLRADPLGAKAFHDSLQRLDRISVQRNYLPVSKLQDGPPVTFFLLGATVENFSDETPEDEVKDLEALMLRGGRLVISLLPVAGKPEIIRYREKKEKQKELEKQKKESSENGVKKDDPTTSSKPEDAKKKRPSDPSPDEDFKWIFLTQRWGVNFDYKPLLMDPETDSHIPAVAMKVEGMGDVDPSLSWHTALFFDKLDPAWKVIYSRDDHPVFIERKMGKGSLLLSADSYFLSNEAMRQERHAPLLAWLVGENPAIIFDETHFGIHEEPGISTLIRKYHLYGLIFGIILLSGLFVWKNAFNFVPSYEDQGVGSHEFAVGKDHVSGFINLLQRNISQSNLLNICFEEWKKSFSCVRKFSQAEMESIQNLIGKTSSAKKPDIITSYNTIRQTLIKRKEKWNM